jgi:GT2 family glycosyltransferase
MSKPSTLGIAATRRHSFSIVVLTFNRNHLLKQLLIELQRFALAGAQVIVVDNASAVAAEEVTHSYPGVTLIRASRNLGAAGRNLGFDAAGGDVIICLDDDVHGLVPDSLDLLDALFADDHIGAVNFKVLEEGSARVVNWVHHRSVEKFSDTIFDTYEVTEGAVAFRRSVLKKVGGYPETFFLSHEGPDLAFRIINSGSRVIYCPAVCVSHSFAPEGRTSWRNYYYDTRNTFWLAARNLPLLYALKIVSRQTLAMFLYSLRDGYTKWWLRGLWHGLKGIRVALRQRQALTPQAMQTVRSIDRHRPSLLYVLRRRLADSDFRL